MRRIRIVQTEWDRRVLSYFKLPKNVCLMCVLVQVLNDTSKSKSLIDKTVIYITYADAVCNRQRIVSFLYNIDWRLDHVLLSLIKQFIIFPSLGISGNYICNQKIYIYIYGWQWHYISPNHNSELHFDLFIFSVRTVVYSSKCTSFCVCLFKIDFKPYTFDL